MASPTTAPNANGPTPKAGQSPRSYYGLLFDGNKKPTKILDALIRAIGQYIIDNIGDRRVNLITPSKLAEVYRPFPSDIDGFLLESSPKDLSNIWAVMGYEHHLVQPNNDRYARPSVPALTVNGFVSWLAVQLLVDPAENVPVVQYAVRQWKLRNPDTGEPFPEVPATAFPTEPDRKTEQWEEDCGKKLLKQAEEFRRASGSTYGDTRGRPPPHTRVSPPSPEPSRYAEARRGPYEYVRVPTSGPPRGRSGTDPEAMYGARVPYAHFSSGPRYRRSPERDHDRNREREWDRREKERIYVEPRSSRYPRAHVSEVPPEESRRQSSADYHGREPHNPRDYGPHSASDPHLKTTQAASSMPPPPAGAASAPPSSGSARPGPGPHVRKTPMPEVESESESTETETESETDSEDESPGGTRPQRRRVPRPASRPTVHSAHSGEPIPESVNRIFRERAHSGEVPPITPAQAAAAVGAGAAIGAATTSTGHGQSSPRLRPAPPHGHVSSSDPRRRSQGGIAGVVSSIPVIGNIVGSMTTGGSSTRRPHSHDSRYQPARAPRRYSDEDITSDDDYIERRKPVSSRHRADMEASRKEQDRAKIERDRRRDREYERERGREERQGRHLRRPELMRRTSSHTDAERRARDRDRDIYERYKARGPSPGQRKFAVPTYE